MLLVPVSSSNNVVRIRSWTTVGWQIPVMLLGSSVMLLVIGLSIAVYTAALREAHWGDESKIAVCFTISLSFITTCYFVSWLSIEYRIQDGLGKV